MNEDGSPKEDAVAVDSWTSKVGENHDFGPKLDAGKSYILIETACPTGYAKITNVPFSVASDGTITCGLTKNDDGEYEVEDERLVMKINKFDLTSGEEVDGATIAVFKASDVNDDGSTVLFAKPVDSWTSKAGENHDFGSKLDAGESYVLIETACPTGYAKITNVPFTVNRNGTIVCELPKNDADEYEIDDERIVMKVNKYETTGSREIEGAVIGLYEPRQLHKTGTVKLGEKPIAEWTSKGGENHDFGPSLDAGKSYVLVETACPTGYVKTTNVPFSVAWDGSITCDLEKDSDGAYAITDEARKISIETSKKVEGSYGNKDMDFRFEIRFETGEYEAIPTEIPYLRKDFDGNETAGTAVLDDDGKYEFELSHGESIKFMELPYGTIYEATELDGESLGYEVEATNEKGIADENEKISFLNVRNGTVRTGTRTDGRRAIAIALLGLTALASTAFVLERKRRRAIRR